VLKAAVIAIQYSVVAALGHASVMLFCYTDRVGCDGFAISADPKIKKRL